MALSKKKPHKKTQSSLFIQGAKASIPIVLGFIPVSITFGLSAQKALAPHEAVIMSLLVYAGISQFATINLLLEGSGFLGILFAAFVINFRHFAMASSLLTRIPSIPLKKKLFLFPFLTDENFAVASLSKDERIREFPALIGLFLFPYLTWQCGTLIGSYFFNWFPNFLIRGMEFAFFALFLSILVDSLRRTLGYSALIVFSLLLYAFFSFFLDDSISLLLTLFLAPFFFAFERVSHFLSFGKFDKTPKKSTSHESLKK